MRYIIIGGVVMNMNYEIKIDDTLLAYLKKKNKSIISLTVNTSGGGCCPTIEVADVEIREPSNLNDYNKYEAHGVSVFVSKNARVTAPVLRFQLKKSLFVSNIIPIGLSLKGHQ